MGLSSGDCLVGLESAHSLLVDFLWDQGYVRVYVIPPHVVKASRGRYGHSGARTDPSDACLQADLLRTDRARLQRWFPDSLATCQIRAWVSLIDHLTVSIVRQANRLRAVLFRYHPAALELCRDLTSPISPEFIQAYQHEATLLAALLLNLVRGRAEALWELEIPFHQGAHWVIFASIPGAGGHLALALFPRFRDNRQVRAVSSNAVEG